MDDPMPVRVGNQESISKFHSNVIQFKQIWYRNTLLLVSSILYISIFITILRLKYINSLSKMIGFM